MSLSRSAFRTATKLSTRTPATSLLIPRAVASSIQTRSTATSTSNTTSAEAYSLLVAQRKARPIAPHLSIYQPQLTWYMSSANRVTGVMLAGSVYLFGISYAVAPLVGLHVESASIAAAFAALPVAAKFVVKGTLALPFVFHSLNGLRHLTWDTARELTLKGVYRTGYAVLAVTAVSSVYLTFFT
ncbi:mitochondrial succinate dehydrogenase subunit C [Trichophaea hybrida]|nr:mitochondrial succinate dehydrogenase subunit C [Trichophaea hybrida]